MTILTSTSSACESLCCNMYINVGCSVLRHVQICRFAGNTVFIPSTAKSPTWMAVWRPRKGTVSTFQLIANTLNVNQ